LTGAPGPPATPSRASLLLAFAALYLIWGSTYLAIRIVVASVPPFVGASLRFGVAGGGLYLFLRLRGAPRPAPRNWVAAAIVGALLLGGGNGLVCWAEQWVPSGETALIVATVPLWMTSLPWFARRAKAPHPAALAGIAIGLLGVATLVSGAPSDGRSAAAGAALLAGRIGLLVASLSWAVGSLWSRSLPLSTPPLLAAAMQMLTASPILALAGLVRGEWGRFHVAAVTSRSWIALAYLAVFGSLAGFGSYVFLLKHTTPARASTYAFVNPLVAVVLGSMVAGEAVGPRTGVAALLIVAAVGAVVWGSSARRTDG
jgi:drug/metabolite transporter (DMT)-like permease